MAVFKCKMCGGELSIEKEMTVCECEYCGTKQTLPKLDNEKKEKLYDRANHFRRNNEYDKAAGIYEQILNEDVQDAETYWSLVLCSYGIEYVEDPVSHKRVPTINRMSYTSIFEDDNYKSAIKYADNLQRVVYEKEAEAINEIQKGILEISRNEENFDVFICYKETDNDGRRTQDSVLANDLYHQLTEEGFKVFFSRITLEDKLGTAYEPYIFAALNSAKVMVVLGTKSEYFNAVWVKNEWSRYLSLIKEGQKKTLIPAYRDMDPYDLPDEFSLLQAQDMSKLGFMQDLIRGIKKITENTDTTDNQRASENGDSNITAESLLERMYMFLEDREWEKAEEYSERVLDMNPKTAEAYLGKLMVERKCHKKQDLRNQTELLTKSKIYQKVIRFADESLLSEIKEYESYVELKQKEKRKEIGTRAEKERIERESIRKSIELKIEEINQWYQDEKKRRKEKLVNEYAKNINELIEERDKCNSQYLRELTKERVDKMKECLGKWGISSLYLEYMPIRYGSVDNCRHGYINGEGEMVIDAQFDYASNFSVNGLASVKIGNKWGYINEKGEMVIDAQFDVAGYFEDNGLAIVKIDNKWGYINEKGEMVIDAQFDNAYNFASNGLALVKIDNKYGYINEEGEIVIEAQFEEPFSFGFVSDFSVNGLASVKIGNKCGYINEEGEMVIDAQFDDAYGFKDNGLAIVKIDNKWGYINEKGEMVIETQFDNAYYFASNGLALVKIDNKYGYINEEGAIVIDAQFDDACGFNDNGLAPVKIDNKYGYINEKGEMVIDAQFDYAGNFTGNGLAPVKIDDKWGYINEEGEMVIDAQFDYANDFSVNGLAEVMKGWEYYCINEDGEVLIIG